MTHKTRITRSYELTNPIFLKHFEDLGDRYKKIICCNLMAKNIPGENIITETFESHIHNNDIPWVKYIYFDFHRVCKHNKFANLDPIITHIRD